MELERERQREHSVHAGRGGEISGRHFFSGTARWFVHSSLLELAKAWLQGPAFPGTPWLVGLAVLVVCSSVAQPGSTAVVHAPVCKVCD